MKTKYILYVTLLSITTSCAFNRKLGGMEQSEAALHPTALSAINDENSIVQEADIQRIITEPGRFMKEIIESREEGQVASVEALVELILKHGQYTTSNGVNFAEHGINILSTLLDQIPSRKVAEEIFLQLDILDAENDNLSAKAKEQVTLNLRSKEEYLKKRV